MTKRIKQKTVAANGVRAVMISMLFAAAAYANVVTVILDPNLPADYAMYSYVATDGSAQNGIPVAPYPTTLSDTDGIYNNSSVFTISYDYNNPTNVGQGYTGHFATLTDIATMQTTYLANKMKLAGLAGAPISVKGALSSAMWEIMFPSSTKTDGTFFPPTPPRNRMRRKPPQRSPAVRGLSPIPLCTQRLCRTTLLRSALVCFFRVARP